MKHRQTNIMNGFSASRLGAALAATVAVCAMFALLPANPTPLLRAAAPASADAATLRYMAWNRYDLLMNGQETQSAGSSMGGAAFICWQSGLAGKVAIAPCTAMVGVCAARARLRHRWAGMTVQPFTLGYWCWDY